MNDRSKLIRGFVGVVSVGLVCWLVFSGCGAKVVNDEFAVKEKRTVFLDREERSSDRKMGSVEGKLNRAKAGETIVTYVNSPENGDIAVKITLPDRPRYLEGAPVIVDVSTFFTRLSGFHHSLDATEIGAVSISYLWPGKEDPRTGIMSEGDYDYGGPNCISALRSVIRFAAGLQPNNEGRYIHGILEVRPLKNNMGLYAFSHPGIAATNALAYYGKEISTVKYFVGRENPTSDEMYPLEPGHFDDNRKAVLNPFYNPDGYTSKKLDIDYSTVGWMQNDEYPDGIPYFKVEGGEDYVLSGKRPEMWGKSYYSRDLTKALVENGALSLGSWPENLATPVETDSDWSYKTTVNNYEAVGGAVSNLKVMLVFAADDHVQAAMDKPHIHQAYDGFKKTARLWTRLNPDLAYVMDIAESDSGKPLKSLEGFTDNLANTEPEDWKTAREWGYSLPYAGRAGAQVVPLAALAEMADRVRANNWNNNLDVVLYEYEKV